MHWNSASSISRRSTPSVDHRMNDEPPPPRSVTAGSAGGAELGISHPPVERALALISTSTATRGFDDEEVDFSVIRPVTMNRQRALNGTPSGRSAAGGISLGGLGRKGKLPLDPRARRAVVLHPIHSLTETDKREFHAWPAERTLGSSSLHPSNVGDGDGEGPISDPLSVKEIRTFIAEELRLVPATDSAGRLNIYREALNQVINKCTTLAPVLCTIRDAYHARILELEDIASSVLMGDTELRREKEKCLTVQSDTIGAMERERRETDRCKLELFACRAEQEEQVKELARIKQDAEVRIAAAEKLMVMEKVGRLEAESTLETVHTLYRNLRDEHEALQQLHRSDRAQSSALVKTLYEKIDFAELERRSSAQSYEDRIADLLHGHDVQLAKMISLDDHEATKIKSDQINLVNKSLQQRVSWLTSQLNTKNSHEPPIDWNVLGGEFSALRDAGRSSQELVKLLSARLHRAQRSEESILREWSHVFAFKNMMESSDIAIAFNTHKKLVLQQWASDKPKSLPEQPAATSANSGGAVVSSAPPPLKVLRGLLSPVVADIATRFSLNPIADITPSSLFGIRDQIEASSSSSGRVIPALSEKKYKTFPPAWCSRGPGEPKVPDISFSHAHVKAVAVSSFFAILSTEGCGESFFQAVEMASASRQEASEASTPQVYFANLVAAAERFVGDPLIALFLGALRGTFHGAHDLSGSLLTIVRAIGLCLNKTHEILTGSGSAPSNSAAPLPDKKMPLRAVRSALRQVLTWKTPTQRARLVTKLLLSAERLSATVASFRGVEFDDELEEPTEPSFMLDDGEPLLFHWIFGGFTAGTPSPLAIELADQVVDEMLFTAQCASFILSLEARKGPTAAQTITVAEAIAAVGNMASVLYPSANRSSPALLSEMASTACPVLLSADQAAFLILPAIAKKSWSWQRFRCLDMPRLLAEDKPQWSPPLMMPAKSSSNLRSAASFVAVKSTAAFVADADGSSGGSAPRNPDDIVSDLTRDLKSKAGLVRPCVEEIEAWMRVNSIESASLDGLLKSIKRLPIQEWLLRPNCQNPMKDDQPMAAVVAGTTSVDVNELCGSLVTYAFFIPWK